MRHATPPPEPPSLSGDKAQREREAALAFYSDPANLGAAFSKPGFHAYGSADVRDTLNQAFAFKCAYCESSYGPTQPVAIEHYRPKGRVTVAERNPDGTVKQVPKPGYYWLASNWENLLPSCTDCNSPRGQLVPGAAKARTLGKANQFPLVSEAKRASQPGEEKRERRLLLHPYLDQPGDHLHFVDDPDSLADGEVEPAPRGGTRRPSPMGTASIEVYALQRRELINARKAMLTRVRLALMDVEDDLDDIAEHGLTPKRQERYERHVAELKGFANPDQEYSAMCAQVINQAFEALFGRKPA